MMRQNPKISAKVIVAEIDIAIRNVEANINILKKADLIERVGATKSGYWVVK